MGLRTAALALFLIAWDALADGGLTLPINNYTILSGRATLIEYELYSQAHPQSSMQFTHENNNEKKNRQLCRPAGTRNACKMAMTGE
jgi:hypothetical protein